MSETVLTDTRIRQILFPAAVRKTVGNVSNPEAVLRNAAEPQIGFPFSDYCILKSDGEESGLLIDFGTELQGGVEIFAADKSKDPELKLRVRFGESAREALAEFGEKNTTNDHAIRDQVISVPWLGSTYVGDSGFRFVYLSLKGKGMSLTLKTVRAVNCYTGEEKIGSFRCSDERINRIFDTAAYTVTLNMQDYIWDGIKRDRLVWIGDMHPEVLSVRSLYGDSACVIRSLDFTRENTPLPGWMNGLPAYSLWWIVILAELYRYSGKKSLLQENLPYMKELIRGILRDIGEDGICSVFSYFLDWPSSDNPEAQKAGFHALLHWALQDAAFLFRDGGEEEGVSLCEEGLSRLSVGKHDPNGNKAALALLSLTGLTDPAKAAEILCRDGGHGFSTFLGGYILRAIALGGREQEALDCMKEYWGAMLDLGATTFWEDFDLDWTVKACPITEVEIPEDRTDIHGDFGNYCYKGYRHSLCHGWSSGPVSFLTDVVMGIEKTGIGFREVRIVPHLGDLEWAECTVATPFGGLYVRHEKKEGRIVTTVKAPSEIKVLS